MNDISKRPTEEIAPIVAATCYLRPDRTCPTTWLRSCSPPTFCLAASTEDQAAGETGAIVAEESGNEGILEVELALPESVECLGGFACTSAT